MLVAAAVCPHPPVLVPEVAQGAAGELAGVRAACEAAVAALDEPGATLIVVGGAERAASYPGETGGGLRPYGLDVRVGPLPSLLPLSLTIGRWLLAGRRPASLHAVAFDAPPAECRALGARLAASAPRVALLVMADGTACGEDRPAGVDLARAEKFDDAIASALRSGDAPALAEMDPRLAAELVADGRAPLQVLAGAAADSAFDAELLAQEAPYGVTYHVARWRRRHGREARP